MRAKIQQILDHKQKSFIFIFALSVLISSIVATLIYFTYRPTQITKEIKLATAEILPVSLDETEATPIEEKNIISVLLLGYGGAGHQGGFLTDVIQIVRLDFEKNTVTFISIPRDLTVTLPNGISGKINSAFTLGSSEDPIHTGAQVAKQMATQVTGIPIDAFISVNFVGFKRSVGGPLNGLTVDVTEPVDDPWYPIQGKELDPCGKSPEEIAELTNTLSGFELEKQFECRYEHVYYPVGTHHMQGGEALAFVRSRHGSAAGDFSRSKRQQDVLRAVRDKLFSLEALESIPEFYQAFIAHTDTDLTIEIISKIAEKLALTKDMPTYSIGLSTDNVLVNSRSDSGAYIVVPKAGIDNWSETHNFIQAEIQSQSVQEN